MSTYVFSCICMFVCNSLQLWIHALGALFVFFDVSRICLKWLVLVLHWVVVYLTLSWAECEMSNWAAVLGWLSGWLAGWLFCLWDFLVSTKDMNFKLRLHMHVACRGRSMTLYFFLLDFSCFSDNNKKTEKCIFSLLLVHCCSLYMCVFVWS